MPRKNYDFGFRVRPAMRLREIETILKETRVLQPVPSRPSLIALIECGTLEGVKAARVWLVYEDSFHKWVKSFQPEGWEPIQPTVSSQNGHGDR
jgi:hypothetical protein